MPVLFNGIWHPAKNKEHVCLVMSYVMSYVLFQCGKHDEGVIPQVQIARSLVTLRLIGDKSNKIPLTMFLKSCYRRWLDIERKIKPSPIIAEAFFFLEELRFKCQHHHLIAGGLFIADSAISKHKNLALEDSGACPKFVNRKKFTGEVMWRRRILDYAGYSVLCLDEDKWAAMDDAEKLVYFYTAASSGGHESQNLPME